MKDRMPIHDFLLRARVRMYKLRYYSAVMHTFDWESAVERDGGF